MKAGALLGAILHDLELTNYINQGATAEVYVARQLTSGARYAVKILKPEYLRHAVVVERFGREDEVLSKLRDCWHVVPIHHSDLFEGRPYHVMDLVDGPDMDAHFEQRGRFRLGEAMHHIADAAYALSHAHDLKIVHRDVKPSNMLLDSVRGRLRVTDFGIAKVAQSKATRTGSQIGTLAYIAPETILKGANLADTPADVYALGTILYEWTTGGHPFPIENEYKLQKAILHEDPTPPTEFVDGYWPSLEEVVLRAMSKEPGERFATAGDLLKALEDVERLREPDTAPESSAPKPMPKWITGPDALGVLIDVTHPNRPVVHSVPISGLTLGREDNNDIVVDDPWVSSYHARIYHDGSDNLVIEDLESTNGTVLIDHGRVYGVAPLTGQADLILLGTKGARRFVFLANF